MPLLEELPDAARQGVAFTCKVWPLSLVTGEVREPLKVCKCDLGGKGKRDYSAA